MNTISLLIRQASGTAQRKGPADDIRLALRGVLILVAAAAAYGAAVGSTELGLAVGNLWRVPVALVLSMVLALPPALLAARVLVGAKDALNLALNSVAANVCAGLVLLTLAPLVALYTHTSARFGVPMALIAGGLAALVGMATLLRGRSKAPEADSNSFGVTILLCVLQIVALVQLLALVGSVLPETTALSVIGL